MTTVNHRETWQVWAVVDKRDPTNVYGFVLREFIEPMGGGPYTSNLWAETYDGMSRSAVVNSTDMSAHDFGVSLWGPHVQFMGER